MIVPSSSAIRLGITAALAALLAGPVGAQQSLVVREGLPGGAALLAVDGAGSTSLVLDQVTFLDVDLAGAVRSERFVASLPRPVEGPAPAVRLPTQGSLYRIGRAGQTGWLLVRPDGSHALLALTPDGAGTGQLPWLAVDRSGDRALVAAPAAAGGTVTLLDLVAGQASVLASGQDVAGPSLRLGPDHAWWISGGSLRMADLAGGGAPLDLTPALQASETLHPELVLAGDGRSVALLTEAGVQRRRLHVVDALAGATTVTPVPQSLDAPDYGSAVGPFLALSPDGSRLAWRAELPGNPGETTKELFVQRVDLPAPPEQVTADGQFTDTIDIVGVFGFSGATQLFFMAGEKPGLGDPPDSLGSADLFLVDTTSGVTQNVTASSGESAAPFTVAGELEVLDTFLDAAGERLLAVTDPDEGDFGLIDLPLDGSPGWTLLADGLIEAPQVAAAGDRTLVVLRPEPGLPVQPDRLSWLLPDGTLQSLVELPAGLALDRFVGSRAGPWAACVASVGAPFELPVRIDLVSGAVVPALTQAFALSPALAFTPAGDLALGVGVSASGPFVFGALSVPGPGASGWTVPVGPGFPLAP